MAADCVPSVGPINTDAHFMLEPCESNKTWAYKSISNSSCFSPPYAFHCAEPETFKNKTLITPFAMFATRQLHQHGNAASLSP